MKSNPKRPFTSPIKVQHAGEWNNEDYRHEIPPENSRPALKPLPKAKEIKHLRGSFPEDDLFEPTASDTFREDARIKQVLKKDLKNRNIPNP